MKRILPVILSALLFVACNKNKNEDVVKEPNKEGSIETVVSVKHGNGFDLLTTTHKIWVKNKLEKTLVKVDTLTSLGTTLAEGEDQDGNAKTAMVQKDYEFYITVK